MREFIIQSDDADQRVDKFIMKTMHTMPKSLIYKYIRNKKIKVNHKRCEIGQRLQTGDTMQCYISEEFFDIAHAMTFLQVSSKLYILYEDENVLIMDKPQGLLAHRDTKDIQDNLTDRMLHYLYDKKEYDPKVAQSFTPALCHRIDRNTQGIVIAAKTAAALRFINEKIRNREIEKKYLCIVEGIFEKKEDVLTLYHRKLDGNKVDIRGSAREGYQEIRTGYRVVEEKKQYSLMEVDLLTGKSHQIRGVMAYLHHPLYGDVKYGARKTTEKEYQALCAYQVRFKLCEETTVFGYLNEKLIELKNVDVVSKFEHL